MSLEKTLAIANARHVLLGHQMLKLVKILGTGKKTRDELVAEVGAPRTTVYDRLEQLMHLGVVRKELWSNGERGRPTVYFLLTEAVQ